MADLRIKQPSCDNVGAAVFQLVGEFAAQMGFAIAIPTALAMPCPSGPVVVSMPAAWPHSG